MDWLITAGLSEVGANLTVIQMLFRCFTRLHVKFKGKLWRDEVVRFYSLSHNFPPRSSLWPNIRSTSNKPTELPSVTLFVCSCSGDVAEEVDAEGIDSKERSCVMIQTQYYLSNLSSSYNILQDCGNCSRSVHTMKHTHLNTHADAHTRSPQRTALWLRHKMDSSFRLS